MNYFTEKTRLKQVFLCFSTNIFLSLIITLPLFIKAVNDSELPFLSTFLIYLSNSFWLNLLISVISIILSYILINENIFKAITIILFTFLQAFLIADVKIFSFFKFHINAIVLNFLFTEGASDSLKLGNSTLIFYGFIVFIIALIQWYLLSKISLKLKKMPFKTILIFLIIFFADKITFAYADLKNKTEILSASRFFPLYQKFTAERILTKYFGIKPETKINANFSSKGTTLNYPLKQLTCENPKKYNILFIVADGFRYDMLNEDVMPNLFNFAKENILFENHFSGGNGTRFGIFTLIYGLYGNLWHNFLSARQSPVLLDTLQNLNYDFTILSSTRLSYPEFRSTAFIKLQDYIFDTHTEPLAYKRDKILVNKFKEFIAKNNKPFFGFIFFNSSHQFYQYPIEFEKFKPVLTGDINYMKNMTPEIVEKLKNRYKNSLYYIDSLIKEVIDILKKEKKLENTIIIITGDHGEEFNENGFFSHTSAFDDYQIKTAMVMHIPNKKKQKIDWITSHIDIAPTILNLIGCKTEPNYYSNGNNIFDNQRKNYTFSFNWYDGAVVTKDYRIVIPLTTEKTKLIEIKRASDYKNVENKELLKSYNNALLELSMGLGKFLK